MFIEPKPIEKILLRERNRFGFSQKKAIVRSLVYKHFAPNGALAAGAAQGKQSGWSVGQSRHRTSDGIAANQEKRKLQ